jgi:hypothetical protein
VKINDNQARDYRFSITAPEEKLASAGIRARHVAAISSEAHASQQHVATFAMRESRGAGFFRKTIGVLRGLRRG